MIHESGDTVAFNSVRYIGVFTCAEEPAQPVSYAVGTQYLDGLPSGEQIAVLTIAINGEKTTLLETACQVALLRTIGLPVPAERAAISRFDAPAFTRRHASVNAVSRGDAAVRRPHWQRTVRRCPVRFPPVPNMIHIL